MWLDDDEDFDPDSDEGRAAMMHALLEAETGHVSPPPPPDPSTSAVVLATGHSYHSGPPFLRCSVPWGLMLLREADAAHPALVANGAALEALRDRSELTVSVDWGNLAAEQLPGVVHLVISRAGVQVGAAQGGATAPLSVTFSVRGAAAGEVFVASLRWAGGSRHLHCHAPLLAPLRLDGLSAAPKGRVCGPPSGDTLTRPCDGGAPPLACLPERGVGVELELITIAPAPTADGSCPTKGEELAALYADVRARHAFEQQQQRGGGGGGGGGGGCGGGGGGGYHALPALLARCALWRHEVDDHVMFASADVAARTAAEPQQQPQPQHPSQQAHQQLQQPQQPSLLQQQQLQPPPQPQLLESMHAGGAGTMKSEFTSPLPSEGGALNFGRSGAAELACFMRLVGHLGAGAPALSATANGGCSLHVHVNTRSAVAGGDTLRVDELLNVYFAWVAYDLVTAKFARPWMWREPSMAPLYATGAEFAWHEKAWEQGHAATAAGKTTYDVPEFLRAVLALHSDAAFRAKTDAAKLEALFGRAPDTPASRVGRYCSLNLRKLTTYGTLEFRRFHGTLDPGLAVAWAHFCVAFVECFRSHDLGARLLGARSFDEALAELAAAQEVATASALMVAMADFVDPRTAEYFMRNSGAQP